MEANRLNIISILVGVLTYVGVKFSFPQLSFEAAVSCAGFSFFLTRFVLELGTSVPIKNLIMIIAILQWLIGPVLSYYFYPDSEFYYMVVDEYLYMGYVLPAIFTFGIGLFLPGRQDKLRVERALDYLGSVPQGNFRKGLVLLGLGLVAGVVKQFMPGSLRYMFLLLSYAKIIGAFYIFMSNAKFKWIWIFVAFSFEVVTAFGEAMFHDMLLWAGYLFILYCFVSKISLLPRLALLLVLGASIFVIQSIKQDYREVVWENRSLEQSQKFSTALDLAVEGSENEMFAEEDNVQKFVDRINQGWIIARIIYMVPSYEPYARGETVKNAAVASVIPRFLNPNKAKSGGKENFTRFTGIIIDESTSMDVSIIGEAYANFGETGGMIMMLIVGLFFGLAFRIVVYYSIKYPELVLWLPFAFFYAVKAENDLATALNQVVKSVILLVGIIWALNKSALTAQRQSA